MTYLNSLNLFNSLYRAHTTQIQNFAANHRLRTRKVSRVISVKHVQPSLMMDRKRSEIVGVILIVF